MSKETKRAWYLKNRDRVLPEARARYNYFDYILKKYKLTKDRYEKMLADQDGLCATCRRRTKLHVDHCHTTDKVRGLLCFRCNTTVGVLEKTKNIEELFGYIRRN